MATDIQVYGQQAQVRFNPHEHLMQIKNKNGMTDYLPVQWRLVWFREQCPDGQIETEMVHLDMDKECEEEAYVWNNEKRHSEKILKIAKGIAVFKATVRDGKGGVATGYKSERGVSFPDYIEKAETGSIGRALAALGYGTQFAPELEEEHRIVDAPVDKRRQQTPQEQEQYKQRRTVVDAVPNAPIASQNGHQAAQPASNGTAQSEALHALIGKAKNRAKVLGLATDVTTWEALLQEATGEALQEKDITMALIGKVNGHITKIERLRQEVPQAS